MKAYGEEGNDTIDGTRFRDFISGGPGDDTLGDNRGNDRIVDQ